MVCRWQLTRGATPLIPGRAAARNSSCGGDHLCPVLFELGGGNGNEVHSDQRKYQMLIHLISFILKFIYNESQIISQWQKKWSSLQFRIIQNSRWEPDWTTSFSMWNGRCELFSSFHNWQEGGWMVSTKAVQSRSMSRTARCMWQMSITREIQEGREMSHRHPPPALGVFDTDVLLLLYLVIMKTEDSFRFTFFWDRCGRTSYILWTQRNRRPHCGAYSGLCRQSRLIKWFISELVTVFWCVYLFWICLDHQKITCETDLFGSKNHLATANSVSKS